MLKPSPRRLEAEERIRAALREISPHVLLKISPRARRLALRLDSDGRIVNLVVPPRASLEKAREFALLHQDWIRERLADLPEPIPFADGALIPLAGIPRRLRIEHDPAHRRTSISLTEDEILVRTNKDDPSMRLVRFFKEQAKEHISALAHDKAARIGKKIAAIQVRDTRSRWGSCSHDGNLSFCWRLIFAPAEALDYVVAHEIAHLAHMNHGPKFWAQCAALCDDYGRGKRWMRASGKELMRYGG
jgi:predicted metal-dependent hydrolase